ncbi:MAG TPA: hypothetical protein VFO78_01565 [Candidatus Limnocylindrales bacterium]|nr:hypothetical protein [Candidatus Limnocylindrales bacterium]
MTAAGTTAGLPDDEAAADRATPSTTISGGTVVWIDAEEAILVSWRSGEVSIVRLASDVPPRRRSVGHIRHDPLVRHGGGTSQTAADARRRDHLARFVETVNAHLPEAADVTILGTGVVREQLERALREDDRVHRRSRSITSVASRRLTDRQLVARARKLAGDAPRRRVGGVR